MVTSNHGSLGIKKILLGSGGGSVQRGTMTPVIGITAYDDDAEWRQWQARAALLPFVYVNAVRRGGGRPVLLPPGGDGDEACETVAGLDGLVVSGAALTAGVPVLAVCRGMQVLNVCRGGTLHQHVPDLVGHQRHEGGQGYYGRHQVRVNPGSMLAGILPEPGFFDVPTHHHQAVDLLGHGLRAVAWEEDGTVEAVEAGPSELDGLSGFVLGVQWHPEQGDDVRLFGALVSAATERAVARTRDLAPMI